MRWLRYIQDHREMNSHPHQQNRVHAAHENVYGKWYEGEGNNDHYGDIGESDRERFDNMRYHSYHNGNENDMMQEERENGFGISEESLMKRAEEKARANVERKLERHLIERLERQMMDHLDKGMEASLREKKPHMRYGEDMDEDHGGRPLDERMDTDFDEGREPHDSLSRDDSADPVF